MHKCEPTGEMKKLFEEASILPRSQLENFIALLDASVSQQDKGYREGVTSFPEISKAAVM